MATGKRKHRHKRQWGHPSKENITIAKSPWDHGATGKANRERLVIEDRADVDPETGEIINPNGVTGARRVDMLEVYHKRGWISTRGYGAGVLLRDAWAVMQVGTCPPWLRERVDSSPKPDAAIAIQIARMTALLRVSRLVAAEDDALIHAVVAKGGAIGNLPAYRGRHHEAGKDHLRDALERLADRLEGLA